MYVTATLARHDPRSSRVFDDLIRSLPQTIAAVNVAGETDYILTVVARDVTELQGVLAGWPPGGGTRLVTYLRLEEIKPPSRLPLAPVTVPARRRGARRSQNQEAEFRTGRVSRPGHLVPPRRLIEAHAHVRERHDVTRSQLTAAVTACPSTNVPVAEPRSSTYTALPRRRNAAWIRLMRGSST